MLSLPCSVHPPQRGPQHNLFPGQDRISLSSDMLGLSSLRVMFSAGPLWDIVVCQSEINTQCT